MELTIRPLTPDLWAGLEDLFGEHGACNGCWCMYWRIGSSYRKRPRQANKAAFWEVVERGPPPGLLAFDGRRRGVVPAHAARGIAVARPRMAAEAHG